MINEILSCLEGLHVVSTAAVAGVSNREPHPCPSARLFLVVKPVLWSGECKLHFNRYNLWKNIINKGKEDQLLAWRQCLKILQIGLYLLKPALGEQRGDTARDIPNKPAPFFIRPCWKCSPFKVLHLWAGCFWSWSCFQCSPRSCLPLFLFRVLWQKENPPFLAQLMHWGCFQAWL